MADNFLAAYHGYLLEQDKGVKTIANYLSDLSVFFTWLADEGESSDPAEMTTITIAAYRSHLQKQNRRPSTINRHLISIKLYFAWLHDTGQIPRNPAKTVKAVAQVAPTPRHLTDAELRRMLSAAEAFGNPRDQAVLIVMAHTGLRAAEICNLQWSAVTLNERSGWIDVRAGKGNKYRTVPLNLTARNALREYRAWLDPAPTGETYVFSDSDSPWPTRTLANVVKKYAHHGRVNDVSPHDFRHYFAYKMAEETPLHVLKEIMGHTSIQTTAIYTRPTKEDLLKAAERIANS